MVNNDRPEITLIQGDLRSGKTLCMVAFILKILEIEPNKKIYTNFTLTNHNHTLLNKIDVNTLLSLQKNSVCSFSEVYHIFDRQQSMKKEQIKNTQNIQQIGKKQYKLYLDCYNVNMLNLRLSNQISSIIHCHSTLPRIINQKKIYEINPIGILTLLNNINAETYQDTFLYEIGHYDKINNCFVSNNEFFTLNGFEYYNEYNTYEILNRQKTIHEY